MNVPPSPNGSTTATTDVDGSYHFTGLLPGTYTVVVLDSTLPTGMSATYDLDGTPDHRSSVTVAAGTVAMLCTFYALSAGPLAEISAPRPSTQPTQ